MKTLGEQAAEKLCKAGLFQSDTYFAVIRDTIDTLHAQQPCGCEKLREAAQAALGALEMLDMKPMNCLAYIRELREALAQPCQPASVGSEAMDYAGNAAICDAARVAAADLCERYKINLVDAYNFILEGICIAKPFYETKAHNAALRRQSAPHGEILQHACSVCGSMCHGPQSAPVDQFVGDPLEVALHRQALATDAKSAPVEAWREALRVIAEDDYPEEYVARANEDESARMFAQDFLRRQGEQK